MCGIAGAVGIGDRDMVARMTNMMHYRGPDDAGLYEHGEVCFGHRRLSIIDLTSAGHQPMISADGRLVITFNGEIYNFRELRRSLESKGRQFHSATDTETILHAYDEYGVECLSLLEGMFSFALWDHQDGKLLLARDHLGIKPLFYHLNGDGIAFASELKPMCLIPGLVRRANARALRSIVRYTCNIEDESILQSVFKLPAGEYLSWSKGKAHRCKYWRFPRIQASGQGLEQTSSTLRDTLTEAVKSHLVSDVPVGVALSGGLDSSALVAVMSRLGEPIKTFTAGHGIDDPDLISARIVAEHFGTDHHEAMLESGNLADLLPRVIWHLEEPMGLGAPVQMYLKYEQASRDVKVLLVGEGADELFAGYPHYKIFDRLLPLPWSLRKDLYQRGYMLADQRPETLTGRIAERLMLGEAPPTPLRRPRPRAGTADFDGHEQHPVAWALRHDQCTLLPHRLLKQADATGMAHSLELRVPFLDRRLVDLTASIPDRFMLRRLSGKYILRKSMAPLLPPKILNRPKRSFQIQFNAEVEEAMGDLCNRLLTTETVERRGWFDTQSITALRNGARRQTQPIARRFWNYRIWTVVSMEIWARMFLDRVPPATAPQTISELI
jgi:asparagine synthase (glutamine-hydrolysing)